MKMVFEMGNEKELPRVESQLLLLFLNESTCTVLSRLVMLFSESATTKQRVHHWIWGYFYFPSQHHQQSQVAC